MKKIGTFVVLGAAVFTLGTFVSCTKKNAQAESDTIKIGVFEPMTGANAAGGALELEGVRLANELYPTVTAGGKEYKVELVVADNKSDKVEAANAVQRLVDKEKVKVVLGSWGSGYSIAAGPIVQEAKVPAMGLTCTNPLVTKDNPYYFRVCFIDPFQGTVGGKFATETLGAKRAAVLYDIQNDYSVGLEENFVKAFEAGGGTVVARESYSTGDKDFNAQLTKIKNANPDVVYLPDYYGTVALIARQLRMQGITSPIVGADGWDGLTGNAGDEVLNGFYSNHYAVDSTVPAVQKFVSSFRTKYNSAPNSFAALGYDCVYMLRDAIVKAGTLDAAAVRTALEATNGDYVTGHLTFDERHNPVKSAVMLELVRGTDGKLTSVYKTTVNP